MGGTEYRDQRHRRMERAYDCNIRGEEARALPETKGQCKPRPFYFATILQGVFVGVFVVVAYSVL